MSQLPAYRDAVAYYVTVRTARRTNRLPDFATEDTALRADLTADCTVFFTVAADFFLAGFLDFDTAGLRAMESSSGCLGNTLWKAPALGKVSATAKRLDKVGLSGRGHPSCVGMVILSLEISSCPVLVPPPQAR